MVGIKGLISLRILLIKSTNQLKSRSWDEWVPCPRVLKFSEENLKKQQELLATHG